VEAELNFTNLCERLELVLLSLSDSIAEGKNRWLRTFDAASVPENEISGLASEMKRGRRMEVMINIETILREEDLSSGRRFCF